MLSSSMSSACDRMLANWALLCIYEVTTLVHCLSFFFQNKTRGVSFGQWVGGQKVGNRVLLSLFVLILSPFLLLCHLRLSQVARLIKDLVNRAFEEALKDAQLIENIAQKSQEQSCQRLADISFLLAAFVSF
ncbi:unnamed protein product [Coffea canephora]|uniref:Uncharacterized protein n=1 Tax=Coffea canephora TaxID=49390 RepID=A0A068TZR8_COFCA|nr:unnamed protein product [Coffea canephora]